ncbi:MAG: apolipoprotein N-acyltransferase [Candidatus Omnitrophica bacterium]|jgi:apolipoprotein N-acyltransferase|nr:apolipoprotein N-acyltransferase [Candidatus Omnitrophota bacterium]MDD5079423.1 apolipoprotein N-acyltransferase [Candidatus Omnitrophota bacterium]
MLRRLEKQLVYRPVIKRFVFNPFVLSSFSAILLCLPFFNGIFWLVSWFGFIPLFVAIDGKAPVKAFLIAYAGGIIFWLATVYWLAYVTGLGLALMLLYLALYQGVFGAACAYFFSKHRNSAILLVPGFWVILEYLRSDLLTGFGWALTGYSQCLNLPIIQIADITGVWGVSFLILTANVAIYAVCVKRASAGSERLPVSARIKGLSVPILCLIAAFAYGFYKLNRGPQPLNINSFKVAIIQGNIPQELKWSSGTKDFIINKYLDITRKAVRDNPDVVVWPEAALPVILEADPVYYEIVRQFCRENSLPLLLGAVTLRGNSYYNSAVLTSRQGILEQRYDKLHLVPFGEYIPLRKVLPFLDTIVPIGEISFGREYTLFDIAGANKAKSKFGVLICFEDVFPELSRNFVRAGAGFLVNITNDAWYMHTPASFQHSLCAVFRAVENRVPVARCANTGISEFIAPKGKAFNVIRDGRGRNIFIDGHKTALLSTGGYGLTFYTRYGDIFILILAGLLGAVVLRNRRKNV